MVAYTGAKLLTEANELINKVLNDLPIGSEIGDDLLEARLNIMAYMSRKEIIRFVMENYTTEQIVKRCEQAVVEAYIDEYRQHEWNRKQHEDRTMQEIIETTQPDRNPE